MTAESFAAIMEGYDQVLPVSQRVELAFRLSGEEDCPVRYLQCSRSRAE